MKIVKLVLYILFGLMFINAGLNKFFLYMPMPELTPAQTTFFTAFSSINWLIPLVATVEILGGMLVILPKTRALGAIVIFPVVVGILVHHIFLDQSGVFIASVLMAVNLLAIYDHWDKYKGLVKS